MTIGGHVFTFLQLATLLGSTFILHQSTATIPFNSSGKLEEVFATHMHMNRMTVGRVQN